MVPTVGVTGAGGIAGITTLDDEGDTHPASLVTI
jgi:hypothetical protein